MNVVDVIVMVFVVFVVVVIVVVLVSSLVLTDLVEGEAIILTFHPATLLACLKFHFLARC